MDYNKVPFLFLSESKITVNPLYTIKYWNLFERLLLLLLAWQFLNPKTVALAFEFCFGSFVNIPTVIYEVLISYRQTDIDDSRVSFAILNKVSKVKFVMSPKDCVLLMDVTMYWPWGSGPWWTIKLHQNIIRVTQAAHLHIQLTLTLSTMGMSEL